MNFLRDGTVALPDSRRELLDLLQEAKYYLVQDLTKLIEATLKRLGKDDVEPMCRIPLVTSQREEQSLIATTVKVWDFNTPAKQMFSGDRLESACPSMCLSVYKILISVKVLGDIKSHLRTAVVLPFKYINMSHALA